MNDVKILPLQLELGCQPTYRPKRTWIECHINMDRARLWKPELRCLQRRDILQPGLPAKDSFFMKWIFKY